MAASGNSSVTDLASTDCFGLNPYLALGLRGNPFAAEDAPGVSDDRWIDRGWSAAPAPGASQLVQIVGAKGVGKTSHLKHWQAQTGGPYCYYPPGWDRFRLPPVDQIAYWDEADRIPLPMLLLALARAKASGATVVLGTHADRSAIARRLGLAVTTISLPPLDAGTVMHWATRRIEAARLPHQRCRLGLTMARIEAVLAIADGSWRIVADHLHIWAAQAANTAAGP